MSPQLSLSGSLAGEKVCCRATPPEQVPQKQPRPVHFDPHMWGTSGERRGKGTSLENCFNALCLKMGAVRLQGCLRVAHTATLS